MSGSTDEETHAEGADQLAANTDDMGADATGTVSKSAQGAGLCAIKSVDTGAETNGTCLKTNLSAAIDDITLSIGDSVALEKPGRPTDDPILSTIAGESGGIPASIAATASHHFASASPSSPPTPPASSAGAVEKSGKPADDLFPSTAVGKLGGMPQSEAEAPEPTEATLLTKVVARSAMNCTCSPGRLGEFRVLVPFSGTLASRSPTLARRSRTKRRQRPCAMLPKPRPPTTPKCPRPRPRTA